MKTMARLFGIMFLSVFALAGCHELGHVDGSGDYGSASSMVGEVRRVGRANRLALAAGLLGGHVAGGADHRAGLRLAAASSFLARPKSAILGTSVASGGVARAERRSATMSSSLCRALRSRAPPSAARQQHVGRLQVAVDEPGLVGGVDGPRQRLHQPGGLAGGSGVPRR